MILIKFRSSKISKAARVPAGIFLASTISSMRLLNRFLAFKKAVSSVRERFDNHLLQKEIYIKKFLNMWEVAKFYTSEHESRKNKDFEFENLVKKIDDKIIFQVAEVFFHKSIIKYLGPRILGMFGATPSENALRHGLVFDFKKLEDFRIDRKLYQIYVDYLEKRMTMKEELQRTVSIGKRNSRKIQKNIENLMSMKNPEANTSAFDLTKPKDGVSRRLKKQIISSKMRSMFFKIHMTLSIRDMKALVYILADKQKKEEEYQARG